jgi:hypothetical protein
VVQVVLLVLVQLLVCHQAPREQEEQESARHPLLVGGSLVLVAHITRLQQQPTQTCHNIGCSQFKRDKFKI